MKILLCFGTRPEAIKMAPVIYELKKRNLPFKVCVTAQHREMLDQVLDFFGIVPDYDLNLMKPGQSLNSLSALVLNEVDEVLENYKPGIILVQGDTSTAFSASLAAFHRKIYIGHIEAGLRTGKLYSPYPEEANRQLISRISNFHFAPTSSAMNNLLNEAIDRKNISVTGNTVIDSLKMAQDKLAKGYENNEIEDLQSIIRKGKKMILVTGHRRENLGRGLEEVFRALLKIAERKDIQIIFPVHLNPKVGEAVNRILGSHHNIHILPPVNYPAFVWLMLKTDLIITDSGGIQEEAPGLQKPVIITRDSTERMEGVKAGFSFLTGTVESEIIKVATNLLDNPPDYSNKNNPFGDGLAAKRIVEHLVKPNF